VSKREIQAFFILLIYYFSKREKGVLMMAQFIPGRLSADHQQRGRKRFDGVVR
jgi:hypothetical protein